MSYARAEPRAFLPLYDMRTVNTRQCTKRATQAVVPAGHRVSAREERFMAEFKDPRQENGVRLFVILLVFAAGMFSVFSCALHSWRSDIRSRISQPWYRRLRLLQGR